MTTARNRTEPPVNRRLGFEAAPNVFVFLKHLWNNCNLGFAGSCEYLLNKSAYKIWNSLIFKESEWCKNTQVGLGLWGYHDNTKSACFQKPVDNEKVDADFLLIFKYVEENIVWKNYTKFIWANRAFFWAPEGTSFCTESLGVRINGVYPWGNKYTTRISLCIFFLSTNHNIGDTLPSWTEKCWKHTYTVRWMVLWKHVTKINPCFSVRASRKAKVLRLCAALTSDLSSPTERSLGAVVSSFSPNVRPLIGL